MIYVVLGMHKSGTTLISKIFHESGINMGQFDPLISYDQGNQYERTEFQEINKTILNCGDSHSTAVIFPLIDNYKNENVEADILTKVNKLDVEYPQWGFKDPRTCLTYDFWSNHIPKHKVIYVYRSPVEVWNHYQKIVPKYRLIKKFLAGSKAVKAWYVYNNQLLKIMNKSEGSGYIIEYSEFMQQKKSIEKLSIFVGCSLSDSRDNGLYRGKNPQSLWYEFHTIIARVFMGFNVNELFNDLNKNKNKNK
jgi:hypothetical protein